MNDLIRRADAIEAICMNDCGGCRPNECGAYLDKSCDVVKALSALPSAEAEQVTGKLKKPCDSLLTGDSDECKEQKSKLESAEAVQGWIPCSERLPENIRPVIVTWKNTDPASYYQYIVGKHFIGTAHYYRGKWYWYSSVTEDLLAEYGKCESEEFDEAIEAVAWMPLPKPYREESEVEE